VIRAATSDVTLAQVAPSFLLLDATHVAGIILRSDGSGAYGGGSYDIIGPRGSSLGYPAKAGDAIALFGTGFGPTNPAVPAGQALSGVAATTSRVIVRVNNVSVTTSFAGLSGAGLYQINLTIPAGLGTGDVALLAMVGGVQTSSGVVISLQQAGRLLRSFPFRLATASRHGNEIKLRPLYQTRRRARVLRPSPERPQGSPIEYENAQKRILEVFGQWKAPANFKIEFLVVRVGEWAFLDRLGVHECEYAAVCGHKIGLYETVPRGPSR